MSNEVLFSQESIQKRVRELACEISRDYDGSELLVVGVLKGAYIFMADLVRALTVSCRMDFIRVSSYGSQTESSGSVQITKDIEISMDGRNVLVVEDIVDTGLTLRYIVDIFTARNPKSIKVCAFLDKRKRRKIPFEADYVGFTMDDGFVVGYGLDYNEEYRYLPDVCTLEAGSGRMQEGRK